MTDLDKRIDEYLALAEMATPGPWEVINYNRIGSGLIVPLVPGRLSVGVLPGNKDDAYFIAASHEAAKLIRELRAERDALRSALFRACLVGAADCPSLDPEGDARRAAEFHLICARAGRAQEKSGE